MPTGGCFSKLNVEADYEMCQNDPTYIATGRTACCPYSGATAWTAGVCDLCSGSFTCPTPPATAFRWGAMLAVIVNTAISVGMALQKTAHTRVERRITASAKISEEAEAAARKQTFTGERLWWLGFLMQVGGEIGNLVAYGDPNTPSSVVASLGCVAVIANAVISGVFLGEGWRQRDGVGVLMIIFGVILIIVFVPQAKEGGTHNLLPCPLIFSHNYSAYACELPATWPIGDSFTSPHLSGVAVCEHKHIMAVGSDYWYMVQPEW